MKSRMVLMIAAALLTAAASVGAHGTAERGRVVRTTATATTVERSDTTRFPAADRAPALVSVEARTRDVLFWLFVAIGGTATVFVAGYLLVSRQGRHDRAHLLLGGIGYLLLIAATFALGLLAFWRFHP